jgi:hypothetical protein
MMKVNNNMKASEVKAVRVLEECILPNGVRAFKASCVDYDSFRALPNVVELGGVLFGLTGWNSDDCVAYYRNDARVALEK